jgi:hypothetical protein
MSRTAVLLKTLDIITHAKMLQFTILCFLTHGKARLVPVKGMKQVVSVHSAINTCATNRVQLVSSLTQLDLLFHLIHVVKVMSSSPKEM